MVVPITLSKPTFESLSFNSNPSFNKSFTKCELEKKILLTVHLISLNSNGGNISQLGETLSLTVVDDSVLSEELEKYKY